MHGESKIVGARFKPGLQQSQGQPDHGQWHTGGLRPHHIKQQIRPGFVNPAGDRQTEKTENQQAPFQILSQLFQKHRFHGKSPLFVL